MRTKKGFTIIELLIVIVIIGILVAITAISYTGITNSANTAKAQANARNVKQAVLACHAKNGVYPATTPGAVAACDSGITLPAGISVDTSDPTSANGTTYISYTLLNSAPVIKYYDYDAGEVKEL